jgi:hypothetical protein
MEFRRVMKAIDKQIDGSSLAGSISAYYRNFRILLRKWTPGICDVFVTWGHRRDAYDTLGLATCVRFRPSEKYHRRPACVAR